MKLVFSIFLIFCIATSDLADHILMVCGVDICLVDQPQESEKESKSEESAEDESKIEFFDSLADKLSKASLYMKYATNHHLELADNLFLELNSPPPELT